MSCLSRRWWYAPPQTVWHLQMTIYYSLLTTHYLTHTPHHAPYHLLLTTHYLLFTTRCSLLATCYFWLLTTCDPLLATRYLLLLATHQLLLATCREKRGSFWKTKSPPLSSSPLRRTNFRLKSSLGVSSK